MIRLIHKMGKTNSLYGCVVRIIYLVYFVKFRSVMIFRNYDNALKVNCHTMEL